MSKHERNKMQRRSRRLGRVLRAEHTTLGLPPGTLIHVGEQRAEPVKLTLMRFNENDFEERELAGAEELAEAACAPEPEHVTWINLDGLHQIELLEQIGHCFAIHPLVLEDILNTSQRPKYEDYGDYLYIVLKMLTEQPANAQPGASAPEPAGAGRTVRSEQVSLIIGRHYVLSFQEGLRGDAFDIIRDRIRAGKGRVRRMGADYLAYSLLDAIVDQYFAILETTGDAIEQLEADLIENPSRELLGRVQEERGELLMLRRSVWPLREAIASLERAETDLIQPAMGAYLRDLYDHTIQVIDTIETFRDIIAGMMDIYLSSVSNRMNEVMKLLTLISTVFLPLNLIAGIFGMNFDFIPGLHNRWGFWGICLLMTTIIIVMIRMAKRKQWL